MTTPALRRAVFLFKMLQHGKLMKMAGNLTLAALRWRLPVEPVIKPLVFRHFCGGESLNQCIPVMDKLMSYGVSVIPDFSAEGKANEKAYNRVKGEVLKTIELAASKEGIAAAVFKPTGIAPFGLWEKMSSTEELDADDREARTKLFQRLDEIFEAAFTHRVPVMVDAEESWIQPAVDGVVRHYSEKYNIGKVLVYNTVQMYRNDRLPFIRQELFKADAKGYKLGFKIVRGAYHEKEIERAQHMGYPSPVFLNKQETDDAYNAAVVYCFEHRKNIHLCAATHNDQSTLLLAELITGTELSTHEGVMFSQLYGMSDHLTFNLADAGYKVAKYLPYGPVNEVLPYLLRRADENKSVGGQTTRELDYLQQELRRRRG
jgi:proline dehydrogenase